MRSDKDLGSRGVAHHHVARLVDLDLCPASQNLPEHLRDELANRCILRRTMDPRHRDLLDGRPQRFLGDRGECLLNRPG